MTFKYRYRKQILLITIIIIILGAFITWFCIYNHKKESIKKPKPLLTEKKSSSNNKKKEEPKIQEIMVDIKGEIVNPGIYKLEEGSRVIDVINLAGGITPNGDLSVLNLSKKLKDEMVIIIYSYYEVRNLEKVRETEKIVRSNCATVDNGLTNGACIDNEETTTDTANQKISINKATLEELMTLSGVGESKAKSIIEYRQKNGEFKSIDELKKVSGIGDALFDKIKENITL